MPEKEPTKGPTKSIVATKKSQVTSRLRLSVNHEGAGDDFEEWKKARMLFKPTDMVTLTDLELKEEIARVLTCVNPQPPSNLVEFNYAQGCFLPQAPPGNTIVILNIKGTVIHKDSEEAKRQIALMGEDVELLEEEEEEDLEDEEKKLQKKSEKVSEEEIEGEGDEVSDAEGSEAPEKESLKDEEEAPKVGPKKKLTNQFNFCERAALTYNNPNRSKETQTIPPPRAEFGAQVLQWVIYDAYAEDYAIQQREKEKDKKAPAVVVKKPTGKKKKTNIADKELQARIFVAWKTLERMVNLNSYDDIAKDYRYYEDPSDQYRESEGTLLPLWKFSYEKTKKAIVTDIMWNPKYYDLFAVCFGTLVYRNHPQGAVCLFTIKNPSFPEHICLTESSVMCVDIHPKYPFMVVIGVYDGSVFIYNVSITCKYPQYTSNSVTNKHSGIVWKVKWAPDMRDGEMNFYSVAADGKVNNWILMQNDLSLTTIITLHLDKEPVPGPDGTFIKMIGSATSMVFHPTNPLIFLVGTEEGLIYKCSTLYSAAYVFTYNAHLMPVYYLDYNKFNSSIFLSCSGDWRVKIWEDERPEPLFVFDLGATVGCAQWAPYSSTVFAAATASGKVFVFDLNVNKYNPICKQNVVSEKKYKLTRLSINSKLPIIIVGDDKGTIHTLKLSPNLRIMCKAPKKQQHLDQFTLQCMKLDKLLALVREPPTLTPPEDVETVTDQ